MDKKTAKVSKLAAPSNTFFQGVYRDGKALAQTALYAKAEDAEAAIRSLTTDHEKCSIVEIDLSESE